MSTKPEDEGYNKARADWRDFVFEPRASGPAFFPHHLLLKTKSEPREGGEITEVGVLPNLERKVDGAEVNWPINLRVFQNACDVKASGDESEEEHEP